MRSRLVLLALLYDGSLLCCAVLCYAAVQGQPSLTVLQSDIDLVARAKQLPRGRSTFAG